MSIEAPPTLQELTMQILLRNQALVVSSVDSLPQALFLQFFKEAFAYKSTEILKAMVQAWPFPCLPLGALMKTRDLKDLEVALDLINMLWRQKVHPRRCKLQVVDLRNEQQDVWSLGYMAMAHACSAKDMTEQGAAYPGAGMVAKKPVKVFVDICIQEKDDVLKDKFLARLLRWAKKRKHLGKLYCENLQMNMPHVWENKGTYLILNVLQVMQLNYIQELHVVHYWNRDTTNTLVRYVGRMQNLRVFSFSCVSAKDYTSPSLNEWYSSMYSAQLRKLTKLRELRLYDVFFLYGKLHKILRSQTPLESLSLGSTPLKLSDWMHLSQCPSTSQLKYLHLQDCRLEDLSLELLGALLKRVAGTLESLLLEECVITDSQLDAILPALSCCSQLTLFSFFGNHISMAALENLLRHTARLSQLRLARYPAPLESYRCGWGHLDNESFAQVQVKLRQVLRDIRPPHEVQIGSSSLEAPPQDSGQRGCLSMSSPTGPMSPYPLK
ncbi:PRAME family member 8-like [Castor canadensis]|uniref:PRAME family member 8-like n=1 Tax=Castor canadensis TaxID=51338 RepID=A0AC58N238_CASCN